MENGSGMHPREVQVAWNERLASALKESGLAHPLTKAHVSGGKLGRHSEHLGRLLVELQSVARAHPTATW